MLVRFFNIPLEFTTKIIKTLQKNKSYIYTQYFCRICGVFVVNYKKRFYIFTYLIAQMKEF